MRRPHAVILVLVLLCFASALSFGSGFNPPVVYQAGTTPSSIYLGDFNGDNIIDILATNLDSNNLSLLLGNGDGTFQQAVNFDTGIAPTDVVTTCESFTDETTVIAVTNSGSNTVSILISNQDGTFQPAVNYGVGSGTMPMSIVGGLIDFNGDGNCDLAVANAGGGTSGNGNIAVLLGNGDGTFQPAINYDTLGSSPVSIVAGNYNGDSYLDLAVANFASNSVTILPGDGMGGFVPNPPFPLPGSGPAFLFNYYGNAAALVTANALSNNASLLYYGGGLIYHALTFATGSMPTSTTIGQFTQRGGLDLAITNESDNTVTVYSEKGRRVTHPITFSTCTSPRAVVALNLIRPFLEDLVLACGDGVGVMLNKGP